MNHSMGIDASGTVYYDNRKLSWLRADGRREQLSLGCPPDVWDFHDKLVAEWEKSHLTVAK